MLDACVDLEGLESAAARERASLVRLCARLTGDSEAAEDLAQETLLEALRNAHKLHDMSGYAQWLSTIARNVCLRWHRSRGREIAHFVAPDQACDLSYLDDDYDLDVELERHELVDLLDRALALLPPESREVLVERYVREAPHAEIAERLGLTGAAVAKRLERGRLRLKRVLSTDLLREAVAYGLVRGDPDGWEQTDLWCPCCGARHLLGRFTPARELWLICMPCVVPVNQLNRGGSAELFRGVKGYWAASLRQMEASEHVAVQGVAGSTRTCPRCGSSVPFVLGIDSLPSFGRWHYAEAYCERCDLYLDHISSFWVAQATPEGRAFWQEHPRHMFLPEREIEAQGVPAMVVGLRSLLGSGRLEVVLERDTFRRISTHLVPAD